MFVLIVGNILDISANKGYNCVKGQNAKNILPASTSITSNRKGNTTMKKKAIILWSVAALFLVCSIPLFVEGNLGAGVCGIVLAAALGFVGYRKSKAPAKAASGGTEKESVVYVEANGTKYHLTPDCSGMKNAKLVPLSAAKKRGLTACKKCAPYGVAATRQAAPAPASAPAPAANDEFEFLRTKIAGVTFKNGRKSRQTILRAIYFKDEPFESGEMELSLQRYEYEGKPAFGVYVNGEQVGNIPAEHCEYINVNYGRLDGITHIQVYSGGGEGYNFGAEVVLRFTK